MFYFVVENIVMTHSLSVKNLCVSAGEKNILHSVNVEFQKGKNYCLLGKNGSGKSTLSAALMGSPKYQIQSGKIFLNAQDLSEASPEERSIQGLFLSFQNVPEIPGIKL